MARKVSKLPKGWMANLPTEAVAYLQKLEKGRSFDVSELTTSDTTASTTTRTITDTNNSTPGSDAGTDPIAIGYNNVVVQTLFNSFTIIKNELNTLHANDTALADAIEALSGRLNVVIDKLNEVIQASQPD